MLAVKFSSIVMFVTLFSLGVMGNKQYVVTVLCEPGYAYNSYSRGYISSDRCGTFLAIFDIFFCRGDLGNEYENFFCGTFLEFRFSHDFQWLENFREDTCCLSN